VSTPFQPLLRPVPGAALGPAAGTTQCEVCRTWSRQRVCADCSARHTRPVWRCGRCALPVGTVTPLCGTCLRNPPPFCAATCAVDYAFPWDRLIAAFKFHGQVDLALPLARQLTAALHGADAAKGIDLVLPVPLAPGRLAERGYNQAWELARRVAGALALKANATWLQRPVGGAHQADLPREARATNLRGAFMVAPPHQTQLAGLHLALVDDVMTTGATAREASATLLRAGAASVAFWAVARTP
jgi:ComF family protein